MTNRSNYLAAHDHLYPYVCMVIVEGQLDLRQHQHMRDKVEKMAISCQYTKYNRGKEGQRKQRTRE
jgi:hypothetical protein